MHKNISYLYAFFGFFLMACGVVAVDLAGEQANTALITGIVGGLIGLTAGHFLNRSHRWAFILGTAEAALLTILLSWRSGTYFIKLLTMMKDNQESAATETAGMAFLLTTAMLIVAILTLSVSVMFAKQVLRETK
jgi:LytS/YehU family sensor histidine kinase